MQEPPIKQLKYSAKELESEESLWKLYERWIEFHGVSRSMEEKLRRVHVFKARLRDVIKVNKQNPSYQLGPTRFLDTAYDEPPKSRGYRPDNMYIIDSYLAEKRKKTQC